MVTKLFALLMVGHCCKLSSLQAIKLLIFMDKSGRAADARLMMYSGYC